MSDDRIPGSAASGKGGLRCCHRGAGYKRITEKSSAAYDETSSTDWGYEGEMGSEPWA